MKRSAIAILIASTMFAGGAMSSSHREAPLVTQFPKADATDFYMFRSYETGRSGYVTFLANFQPDQSPSGGPNFYQMDPRSTYEINVDNNGDALADLTFQFRFKNNYRNIEIPVNGTGVAVPLVNVGQFDRSTSGNLNVIESYTVDFWRRGASPVATSNLTTNRPTFIKPFDNIGNKSIPAYANYAEKYISRLGVPGCPYESRVFVSQRREGFAVNLGGIFDLFNTNPLGAEDGEQANNALANKNVTTIALEVPIVCLTANEGIIGAWISAHTPYLGQMRQVSRLGMPLVNEVVIGLKDKDTFNASKPNTDSMFATYVTNPAFPELVEILFPSVTAPNRFPRDDLVAAFLTGVAGLNKPASVTASEMLRLNAYIAPRSAVNQSNLGVLGNDLAGFPNGRRPGDDIVDITLRVAMGALLPEADAPSGQLPYTDGVTVKATDFRNTFPYLNTPLPGAVN